MTFDEVAEYLDGLMDELPEGILRELNGGVNLIPDSRQSETDGLSVLGMYLTDPLMGRYIELYYGSFMELYGTRGREVLERELKKTLHHELTHHIEALAGDRSLERDDESFMDDYEALMNGTLDIDSVLFVSFGDPTLSAMAEGLFRARCAERGVSIPCGSAVYTDGEPDEPNTAALKAAERCGAELSGKNPVRLTRAILDKYGAAICMTEDEGDELADAFPHYDARIFAIGERDIHMPKTSLGYGKLARELLDGVDMLIDSMTAEERDA